MADPLSILRADPDGHEPLDDADRIDDPQRRVARPHEIPDSLDDQGENGVQLEHVRDPARGRVERGKALARLGHLRARPRALERMPDQAGHGLARIDRPVEPQRAERNGAGGIDQVRSDDVHAAVQGRSRGQGACPEAQRRQRRRVDLEERAVRACGSQERAQRRGRLAGPLWAGILEQRVKRLDQRGEREGSRWPSRRRWGCSGGNDRTPAKATLCGRRAVGRAARRKWGHLAAAPGGRGRQHSRMSSYLSGPEARSTAAAPAPVRSSTGLRPAFRQVMLATDMGPASAAATDEAFRLAGALGARLLAVSVIDPRTLQLPGGRFRSRVDQERGRLEEAAAELVLRGRRDQVVTSFLIWEGDPAESIVEAAKSEGADIIVVGSHGRAALGRALIGSVSDQVVRHAPCPVMVVRPSVARPG